MNDQFLPPVEAIPDSLNPVDTEAEISVDTEPSEPVQPAPKAAPKRRGRPVKSEIEKAETRAAAGARAQAKPKAPPKVIERVVREYVEVPVQQQSPYEVVTSMLRTQAQSERDRKRSLYESWRIV